MKKHARTLFLLCLISLPALTPSFLKAADQSATAPSIIPLAAPQLKYKLLSGLKQPFTNDLQFHLSKGWTPVGGVSVTVWNNDLYFAQLISKRAN